MASSKPPIAFIGLGAMGFGMATNLVKEGYTVRGFDAYPPTLERFAAAGGQIATSPADCVKDISLCVIMVATHLQASNLLREHSEPAVPSFPKDVVLMLCSTVSCGYVQGLAEELAKDAGRPDIKLVDCPVSGGAGRAATGELSIMASGTDEALAAARELLQAMSDPQKLYIVKGGIGMGSNMKMCHQVLAAAQILSVSEAMGYAARLSLDFDYVGEEVIKGEGWSWLFENRLGRIRGAWDNILSALTIIAKDAGIITSEGRRLGFPTPMTSAAEQIYLMGISRGWDNDDDSGMVRAYLQGTGEDIRQYAGKDRDADRVASVTKLLRGIHTCAAAEALAFGKHVGLDLEQLHTLSSTAAGGSKMFAGDLGSNVVCMLNTQDGSVAAAGAGGPSLDEVIQDLRLAVDQAHHVKCPLFLGSEALSLASAARKSCGDGSTSAATIVQHWFK